MLGKWIYAPLFTERFQTVAAWREFCFKLHQSWAGELHIRDILRDCYTDHKNQNSPLSCSLIQNWDSNRWPSKCPISIQEHTRGVSKSPILSCHYKGRILSQLASFIIKCCEKPSMRWWETLDLPMHRSLCSAQSHPVLLWFLFKILFLGIFPFFFF